MTGLYEAEAEAVCPRCGRKRIVRVLIAGDEHEVRDKILAQAASLNSSPCPRCVRSLLAGGPSG